MTNTTYMAGFNVSFKIENMNARVCVVYKLILVTQHTHRYVKMVNENGWLSKSTCVCCFLLLVLLYDKFYTTFLLRYLFEGTRKSRKELLVGRKSTKATN